MHMCEQWRLHCTSVLGGRRHWWVSMCTVWLSHSKWLREWSNKSASNFALSLNIPPWKLFGWFRIPQVWVAGTWQLHHDNVPTHASHLMQSFWWNIRSPACLSPLHLWFLAFPKIKITFEREELSGHWWDSGKKWQGSWWWLGELCEVPRCLLWRGLKRHCPMYNVFCILYLLQWCLYFS